MHRQPGVERGVDLITQDLLFEMLLRRAAAIARLETRPRIPERRVLPVRDLARNHLLVSAGIVDQIEISELSAVDHRLEKAAFGARRKQIEDDARFEAGHQICDDARPTVIHQRADIRGIARSARAYTLQQRASGLLGEYESRLRKMLVEVGRSRVRRHRFPLRSVGRQQQDFRVTAIGIRGETSSDWPAIHRLPKHQVAIGQIQADIFLGQIEIPDAIALCGIKTGGQDSLTQIGCRVRLRPRGNQVRDGNRVIDQRKQNSSKRTRCRHVSQ